MRRWSSSLSRACILFYLYVWSLICWAVPFLRSLYHFSTLRLHRYLSAASVMMSGLNRYPADRRPELRLERLIIPEVARGRLLEIKRMVESRIITIYCKEPSLINFVIPLLKRKRRSKIYAKKKSVSFSESSSFLLTWWGSQCRCGPRKSTLRMPPTTHNPKHKHTKRSPYCMSQKQQLKADFV